MLSSLLAMLLAFDAAAGLLSALGFVSFFGAGSGNSSAAGFDFAAAGLAFALGLVSFFGAGSGDVPAAGLAAVGFDLAAGVGLSRSAGRLNGPRSFGLSRGCIDTLLGASRSPPHPRFPRPPLGRPRLVAGVGH